MGDTGIGPCPHCQSAEDVTSVTIDRRALARCWACGYLWSELDSGGTTTSRGEVDRRQSTPT